MIGWFNENRDAAALAAGSMAVVMLPGLRRFAIRKAMRPFQSDEVEMSPSMVRYFILFVWRIVNL